MENTKKKEKMNIDDAIAQIYNAVEYYDKQHDSGDSHQQGRNRAGGNASKPLGSIKCLSGHGYFLN